MRYEQEEEIFELMVEDGSIAQHLEQESFLDKKIKGLEKDVDSEKAGEENPRAQLGQFFYEIPENWIKEESENENLCWYYGDVSKSIEKGYLAVQLFTMDTKSSESAEAEIMMLYYIWQGMVNTESFGGNQQIEYIKVNGMNALRYEFDYKVSSNTVAPVEGTFIANNSEYLSIMLIFNEVDKETRAGLLEKIMNSVTTKESE